MRFEAYAAAHVAAQRAAACRQRLDELAAGRQVAADDIRRAETALASALERAAAAQRRLTQARLRQRPGAPARTLAQAPVASRPSGEPIDIQRLRERAAGLAEAGLFAAYFAIGGHCDELELDAFLHEALELPADELAVLAHAVWELTEL